MDSAGGSKWRKVNHFSHVGSKKCYQFVERGAAEAELCKETEIDLSQTENVPRRQFGFLQGLRVHRKLLLYLLSKSRVKATR